MKRTLEMTRVNANWGEFYKKDISEKLPFFTKEGRLYDCLFAQQFNRRLLTHLFKTADALRGITQKKEGMDYAGGLLSHIRAMLYFVQPSTRTFLSFLNACHVLGIRTSEIRDTSTSSEVKGESPEDTVRTFSSYVDMIIMRHPTPGFVEKTAWLMNRTDRPVPIINGGSGKDQHPTQALLDTYTLYRSFNGDMDNKKIVMVGDLKRGRTVRSLTYLMRDFKNISLVFVSPEQFRMEPDILEFLKRHNMPFMETKDFVSVMGEADAIYMTRIQDEHDNAGESRKVDYSPFHFKAEHLKLIKKTCVIMHPLPRRHEIEVSVDEDPRAVFWRQERNGMWARAALMAYIFDADKKIKY